MTDLTIRPIDGSDRDGWEPLWAGYLAFYEQTVPRETTEFTWRRLTTSHEVEGLLAVNATGEALGFAHFLFHPSTWNVGGKCYLQDLFVIPSARGREARSSSTGKPRSSMGRLGGSTSAWPNDRRS